MEERDVDEHPPRDTLDASCRDLTRELANYRQWITRHRFGIRARIVRVIHILKRQLISWLYPPG